ncbi:MAG TPA: amidohydrolase family protein [Aliidongia sp.]|nr:amidohydrolase family protein [Aliidongia sp.]
MTSFLFHGGKFLDPRRDELIDGIELLIESDRVKEVSDRPIKSPAATRIDLEGRTLMPGLIDAHAHVYLVEVDFYRLADVPLTLLAHKAADAARAMLRRGFTTVRDTGGGDWGIKVASETGLIEAPRLFVAGRSISQTGGHADFRRRTEDLPPCACCSGIGMTSRIADGVDEMTKAVRDELRKGADFVKIMVSGGVSSQADPLEATQYRLDEIAAATEAAAHWGSYVAAHAYTAEAVKRAVGQGVRTIEHGNMIDAEAAAVMAKHGAFLVPTLVAYDALKRRGPQFGLSEYSLAKNEVVLEAGSRSIALAKEAGVSIGFGSDLLGQLQIDQSREFLIRGEFERPIEVLRSATLVNARIVRQEGLLGELVPGAYADLLVVEGDPTRDLSVLAAEANITQIWRGGRRCFA